MGISTLPLLLTSRKFSDYENALPSGTSSQALDRQDY